MKKSIDLFCRNTIKRSISPSISFDNTDLRQNESLEDYDFFNTKFIDTLTELFDSLDDIVYFSNFEIKERLENYCKNKKINFENFENVKINFFILDVNKFL